MYQKMYYSLFNAVTQAIEQLERHDDQLALFTLERAQHETEDIYINGEEGEEQSHSV